MLEVALWFAIVIILSVALIFHCIKALTMIGASIRQGRERRLKEMKLEKKDARLHLRISNDYQNL